jgi:hypothetical protein
MNQRPQAFPTLLHCPDSRQHHNPPDYLRDRRRWVNQPQVLLLKQGSPQPALHLSADSLSDAHSQKACCRNRSQYPWAPAPTTCSSCPHVIDSQAPEDLIPLYPFFHGTRHSRPKQPMKVVTAASTCSRVAALCCGAWTTNRRWA